MNNEFTARQSLNGLGTTYVCEVPDSRNYFIDGQLTIPSIVKNGDASEVIAYVNVNNVPVYSGLESATGFQTTLSLISGDDVSVTLSSSADVDEQLNAVRGVVTLSVAV
jgi:hypothetical protein